MEQNDTDTQASQTTHGPKRSKWGGELPYPNKNQMSQIRNDWVSWELLSRGILLGSFGGMEPQDIANVCGYDSSDSVRQRKFKAIEHAKVTQGV